MAWVSPEEVVNQLTDALFSSQQWRGFGIDSSLQSYSGLNSTAVLDGYRDQVLYSGGSLDVASSVEKLGAALAGLAVVPNAVGLGALIISMVIEVVGKNLGKPTMGTAEMLQRVFAEEKASEVRDLMEEYLKRLRISLGKPEDQLVETVQIEVDLSAQLTRLKNSMLVDGHMNSQFLKQWVNGAAFHTQMLIHQARLEGEPGTRAVQAAGVYQQQLNLLMDKYKNYLKTAIYMAPMYERVFVACCLKFTENEIADQPVKCVVVPAGLACSPSSDVHAKVFANPQLTWTESYFSDLSANIPALVRQNGTFIIQN